MSAHKNKCPLSYGDREESDHKKDTKHPKRNTAIPKFTSWTISIINMARALLLELSWEVWEFVFLQSCPQLKANIVLLYLLGKDDSMHFREIQPQNKYIYIFIYMHIYDSFGLHAFRSVGKLC